MTDVFVLPGGAAWKIDDIEFKYSYSDHSTVHRFALRKRPSLVEKYIDLCRSYEGANVVELGIAAGGSTALLALLARPRKLVALEIEATRVDALDRLRALKGLESSVRPYYGVDQGDRDRVVEIIDEEFGDRPLDLVIDDASHVYAPTVASFDVLYPRLRPGGVFVIEDWGSDRLWTGWIRATLANADEETRSEVLRRLEEEAERTEGGGPVPLHRIGPELMELALGGDVVAEVTIDRHWLAVRRGPAELDRETFRLADARTGDWEWRLP